MIRAHLVQQLRKALSDSGTFDPDDFVIETKQDRSGDTSLKITPRFAGDYSLVARIVGRRGANITITTQPGSIVQEDSLEVSSWDNLVAETRQWRNRIETELKAEPIAREIDVQRKALEKLLSSVGKVEDTYFSQQEATALRGKLDTLEQTLAEQITKAAENEAQLEAKLAALHSDIETLKQSLDSLRKPGWVQRVGVKVGKWMGDPDVREAIKGGTEIVKGFLKSGGQ